MRLRIGIGALTACAVLCAASGATARVHSVEDAKATSEPLKLVKREAKTFRLKNGIEVYFLEDARLPLVTVRAVVRTGAIWEPAEKLGVADLTGRMMRSGGTTARTSDEVDDELDFLAARLSTIVDADQSNATMNVLVENLDPALAIFSDVLRRPTFETAKIDVQKNLIKEGIRRQNDNPVQVAIREYSKLVWGEKHPRARQPTEETVDALAREDLIAFHTAFFQPSNVMIGVAGAVSKGEIEKKLNRAFGDWKGHEVAFPEVPAPQPVVARAAVADKAVPQSTILIGQLGPRENDPHRAAGQVMMDILGSGGFTSYIVDRVRNDEGLAYAAGGFLRFGHMEPGAVLTFALSKTESTCRAADLILEQVERIRTEDVTDDELNRAREGILNSEAFEYDSSEEIVANVMDLAYYGLPADHAATIVREIGTVTKAQVREAANALMDPSKFTILAVGNVGEIDCEWTRYAERLHVDLQAIRLE
jgi:predicted Zn-dependent peptidase